MNESNGEPAESKPDEHVWEQGFEDHEIQQLRRMARLTLPEKLQWLEDAHRLVMRLEAERKGKAE